MAAFVIGDNEIEDGDTDKAEGKPAHVPAREVASTADTQVSPAGDEPPLVRTRLSKDGTEIASETLSPTGDVIACSEPIDDNRVETHAEKNNSP